MIIQGLIATIAVLGATIKMYWYQLKAFFSGKERGADLQESAEAGEDKQSKAKKRKTKKIN